MCTRAHSRSRPARVRSCEPLCPGSITLMMVNGDGDDADADDADDADDDDDFLFFFLVNGVCLL